MEFIIMQTEGVSYSQIKLF